MESTEVSLNPSFGVEFENSQTQAQLELLDDLQKMGVANYLDLPQLVVVGDQSTGKSSVLQAVTGLPFSVHPEMCTRFATEIRLERTQSGIPVSFKIEIIPDADETQERKEALSAWRPARFDENGSLSKDTMKSIFEQAEDVIVAESTPRRRNMNQGQAASRLSSSTLRITKKGPTETNLAIVDIPGLIRGNETQKEYRTAMNLVQRYLKNSRSIIAVVIDIVDTERQGIFQLLKDLPDEQNRAIGVINKCDTKQSKSDDWIFNLIENDPSRSKHYLKAGWYGLRNRTAAERDISDEERDKLEETFFSDSEWKSVDGNKLGRHQLKKALIEMRNRHVKKSIPALLFDIQDKLDHCIEQINKLGDPRTDNHAQFRIVNKIAQRYAAMADGAVNGHYEILSEEKLFARKLIRDNLETFQQEMIRGGLKVPFWTSDMDAKLLVNTNEDEWTQKILSSPTYAWISAAIKSYRGKEDVGEVNPEVKDQLWKQQIVSWKDISNLALDNVERTIESVNMMLFEEACPDKLLRSRLQVWLQDGFRKASADARGELNRLLDNEHHANMYTLNPYRRYQQQYLRNDRIQKLTEKMIEIGPEVAGERDPIKIRNHINTSIYKNGELVGILNTHDTLAAYYDVALYRFIDNFALQVVERHLLGPHGPLRLFNCEYVGEKLNGPQNEKELNDLADEDPATAQLRRNLDAQRASLEEGKIRVQNFKVL